MDRKSKTCYICGSDKFIDEHHYDCKEGKICPLTVPLCRRCHRTYHDFGLESFSPDTTARALVVENRRRVILGRSLMTMNEIHRSGYWYKKWGITRSPKKKAKVVSSQLPLFGIETRIGSLVWRG